VGWERISGGQGWRAEYYANQKLEGDATLIRTDPAIDFAWDYGSPDPSIPADHFSVRWSRTLGFEAGVYRFLTSTDDGVRLWVDGQLVVDAWHKQKLPNTHSGDLALGAGLHQITVEYFEEGGEAHAHAWWQRLNGLSGWQGEYFDNRHMVGGPALVRDDAEINFDWGTAPPVDWMPDDNFAVRWTRELTFQPGYYRLSVRADDGARVWLDDALIIDKWQEMDNELHYVDGIYLNGPHRLKVEYFEQNGLARVHFWVSDAAPTPLPPTPAAAPTPVPPAPTAIPLPASQSPWQAAYFSNPSLRGQPALVRQDPAIDFDWKLDAPDPALPADRFSVRWQSTQTFAGGRYRFNTYTDDGLRLWVDGELVIESWRPMRGRRSALVDLAAGAHDLALEYFENTEAALARLSWTRVGAAPAAGAPGPWQAEYFDNPDLAGEPLLTRNHQELNFDWNYGSPAPGLPRDDFSIRWTTQRFFEAGRYTFTTYSDDGVRLYVDGRRVINSWKPMRGYRTISLDLAAGQHTVVLEYFEHGGVALARLNWGR
jgi:hypothetical protein